MFTYKAEADPLMDLHHSSSLEQLDGKFKALCENYFIEKFALTVIFKNEILDNAEISKSFSFQNYPDEWSNRYKSKKYYLQDPVFIAAQKVTKPYCWNIDKFANLTESQIEVLSESSDFGIKTGTTIPFLPNNRVHGSLTLLGANIYHPEIISVLSGASHVYLQRKKEIEHRNVFSLLTEREMMVLSLKAEGCLVKQIASKLLISETTVIFHLKNIRKKMGFITTEQVILKYISSGQF